MEQMKKQTKHWIEIDGKILAVDFGNEDGLQPYRVAGPYPTIPESALRHSSLFMVEKREWREPTTEEDNLPFIFRCYGCKELE